MATTATAALLLTIASGLLAQSDVQLAEPSVPPPHRDEAWDLTPPTREPAYQNEPRYALLVFGPKREARIWMALDGTILYVQRER